MIDSLRKSAYPKQISRMDAYREWKKVSFQHSLSRGTLDVPIHKPEWKQKKIFFFFIWETEQEKKRTSWRELNSSELEGQPSEFLWVFVELCQTKKLMPCICSGKANKMVGNSSRLMMSQGVKSNRTFSNHQNMTRV